MQYIYKIENKINGKTYIGKTTNNTKELGGAGVNLNLLFHPL